MLALRGEIRAGDEPVAFVAAREHALGAALAQLANLADGGEPHAPLPCRGDAGEVARQILQTLDDPGVGEQPRGEREHLRRAAQQLEQPARAGCRRGLAARRGAHAATGLGEQRRAAVRAGPVEQRLRPGARR